MPAPLLPLPACHQGVYARLRRAMERVGVRGPFHRLRLAERPPHPPPPYPPPLAGEGRVGATSPRKRGEVSRCVNFIGTCSRGARWRKGDAATGRGDATASIPAGTGAP